MASKQNQLDPAVAQKLKDWLTERHLNGIAVLEISDNGEIHMHTLGADDIKERALDKWSAMIMGGGFPAVPFGTVFGAGNGGKPKWVPRHIPVGSGWEEFSYGPDESREKEEQAPPAPPVDDRT